VSNCYGAFPLLFDVCVYRHGTPPPDAGSVETPEIKRVAVCCFCFISGACSCEFGERTRLFCCVLQLCRCLLYRLENVWLGHPQVTSSGVLLTWFVESVVGRGHGLIAFQLEKNRRTAISGRLRGKSRHDLSTAW
jgi:hypothetical protein